MTTTPSTEQATRPTSDDDTSLSELQQQWRRGTTTRSRMLSIPHPERALRRIGAGAVVGLGLIGLALGLRLGLGSGDAVVAASLVVGALCLVLAVCFLPAALWSRRHPEEAARSSRLQRRVSEARLRRHPVAVVLGLAVACGVVVPLRLESRRHHRHEAGLSTASLVTIGVCAAVVVAVLMTVLVIRARRRPTAER